MAWRIVKQPNGRLARFSDIVDDFTHLDMSEEDALALCREVMPPSAATKKVQDAQDDIEPSSHNVKGNGLSRWKDSLQSIAMVHGIQAVEKLLNEHNFPKDILAEIMTEEDD